MIRCDPRAKAKCPFKDPCCGDEVAYFVEGSDCDKFNQKVIAPSPADAAHTSDWINVKDALPADNEKVLVCTRSKKMCVARWSARQERFVTSGNVTVTHWLPLPGLPREE